MRIKSVEFAGAIGQPGQPPPESARGMPQVAFSGRSNVGKSSLINRLLGRTRTAIARVSATPGKTQEINFYRVRADLGDFFLVDLPGYGFARAPEAVRRKWEGYINGYLSSGGDLVGVVQLIDLRTGATPDDLRSVEYLAELGIPVLFAFTKSDKLTATKRKEAFAETVKALGIEPDQAIAFSALKGDGREDLLETLGSLLFPPGDASPDGEAADDAAADGADEDDAADDDDGADEDDAADAQDEAAEDGGGADEDDAADAQDEAAEDGGGADEQDGDGREEHGGPG